MKAVEKIACQIPTKLFTTGQPIVYVSQKLESEEWFKIGQTRAADQSVFARAAQTTRGTRKCTGNRASLKGTWAPRLVVVFQDNATAELLVDVEQRMRDRLLNVLLKSGGRANAYLPKDYYKVDLRQIRKVLKEVLKESELECKEWYEIRYS